MVGYEHCTSGFCKYKSYIKYDVLVLDYIVSTSSTVYVQQSLYVVGLGPMIKTYFVLVSWQYRFQSYRELHLLIIVFI